MLILILFLKDPYNFSNSDDDGCSPNARLGGPHFPMGFSMPMPLIAPKAKKPRKPRKPRSPKHPATLGASLGGLGGLAALGGAPGVEQSMLAMQALKEEDSRR